MVVASYVLMVWILTSNSGSVTVFPQVYTGEACDKAKETVLQSASDNRMKAVCVPHYVVPYSPNSKRKP